MNTFLSILTNNIVPIFTLIVIGYYVSLKLDLNISTMTKLNFYVFIPAFTFANLYTMVIPMEMLKILSAAILIMIINTVLVAGIGKIRGYDIGMKNAFTNSVIFYNSANIGIPLITLAFQGTGYLEIALTAQIMVMLVQNMTSSTLGFINAGRANTHWKASVAKVLKMPTIYAITLAFLLKPMPYDFTQVPIWSALEYARGGLIPIALLTLGVQLSKTKIQLKDKEVYLSVAMRLVGGPLIALLCIYLLQIEGIMAQVVLISTSVPTAVNAALIAVECDNYPDFLSQSVLFSTLLGSLSLVFVLYIAGILFPVL